MNKVIERVLKTKEVRGEDGTIIPLRLHISDVEGSILYQMVRKIRPTLSIETGMAYGLSTLYIAQAIADNGIGRHIVIDPFQKEHFHNAGLQNLRDAGLADRVEVLQEPSHRVLARLEAAGEKIGFAFIDGSHLFDYAMVDFFYTDLLLENGGILVLDDTDGYSLEKLARFIINNRAYEIVTDLPIVEPIFYRPSLANKLLQALARRVPQFADKLKPEFMHPPTTIGITGRCTVFRKLQDDNRDYGPRDLVPF